MSTKLTHKSRSGFQAKRSDLGPSKQSAAGKAKQAHQKLQTRNQQHKQAPGYLYVLGGCRRLRNVPVSVAKRLARECVLERHVVALCTGSSLFAPTAKSSSVQLAENLRGQICMHRCRSHAHIMHQRCGCSCTCQIRFTALHNIGSQPFTRKLWAVAKVLDGRYTSRFVSHSTVTGPRHYLAPGEVALGPQDCLSIRSPVDNTPQTTP